MNPASFIYQLNNKTSLPQKLRFIATNLQSKYPKVQRFSLALYEPATDYITTFFSTSSNDKAITNYKFQLAKAKSLSKIAITAQPRVINDLTQLLITDDGRPPHPHTQVLIDHGWRSSFTLPLLNGSTQPLGFIFFNSTEKNAFTSKTNLMLEVYGQLIAQLVFQEQLAIKTLTAAARSSLSMAAHRDPETGAHLERTAHFTRLIAENLAPHWQFSDRQITNLQTFAPLHDLGKIAISDKILLKPGKLTDEEFAAMKLHTIKGKELIDKIIAHHGLENLPEINMLRNMVYYHHEKLDGSGYPEGIEGETIPIEARIVSVADIFDALTSERPYKRAWSNDEAFAELTQLAAARKLDIHCVDALINNQEEVEFIQQVFQD